MKSSSLDRAIGVPDEMGRRVLEVTVPLLIVSWMMKLPDE